MKQRYFDIIGISGVEETRTADEIKGDISAKLKAIGGS